MPVLIALLLTIAGVEMDPVLTAIKNYENVRTYQVTLRSRNSTPGEIIRYFYMKPGFVKMEFIKPLKGAGLVYNPYTKKATVTPFSFLKSFHFSLDPGSKLITSAKGHRIDRSDIGELLKSARELQQKGKTDMLGEDNIGGRSAVGLDIKGEGDITVDGIHSYQLWIDRETFLPLKVSSFDVGGKLIEEVLMDDIDLNIVFPDNFFE